MIFLGEDMEFRENKENKENKEFKGFREFSRLFITQTSLIFPKFSKHPNFPMRYRD